MPDYPAPNDRAANDRAYANSDFIPDGPTYLPRWQSNAARFRAQMQGHSRLDVPYGPNARHKFDLFLPQGTPQGLLMFIHGGYWLALDRSDFSHLAAGALARGWACVMPSYTLAPQARIGEITREVVQALTCAAEWIAGPITVTGHSAGGHLAARLANDDAATGASARITRAVPISPLADLAPLMNTSMNADLRLDAAECAAESPALLPLRQTTSAHIWVGAQERPAFLWQARTLSENWACPWTAASGRHHFDVIDDLETPNTPLMNLCCPSPSLL